jgi:hypothetical protein
MNLETKRHTRLALSLRKRPVRPVLALALTGVVAAGLVLTTYLTVTTVPYLATSPTTDPVMGALNACVMTALREPRVGFAVSPDGASLAAYGGTQLVVCHRDLGGAIVSSERTVLGIMGASFDWSRTLWWAAGRTDQHEPSLWHWTGTAATEPQHTGEVSPAALVGHATGVVVLDANGRLLSLGSQGDVKAFAELGGRAGMDPQLHVNRDGSAVVVVTDGGSVFVFSADDLKRRLAERPCEVNYAWWSSTISTRLLLGCHPDWALWVDVQSGQREAAPRKRRIPSVLVPQLGAYVQACTALPCVAPAP